MSSLSSDGKQAASTLSASVREEILHELVDIASNAANAQIDGFTTRLSDALLDAAQACTDLKEAKRYAGSASLLKKNRYPFYYVASERLATALRHEVQVTEFPSTTLGDTSGALHTLGPELEVDKKITLIKAARGIEAENSARMTALNIRLAALLGQESLATAQNPFRPLVFLTVLHDAWCEFQPDVDAHHLVYRLLNAQLCLDMAPILHALNTALIKRGIVPSIAPSALPDGSEEPEEPHAEDNPLMQKLRELFPPEKKAVTQKTEPAPGGFPALFQDDAVQETASRNALRSYLSALERKVADPLPAGAANAPRYASLLTQIRQETPAGALTKADGNVIELLEKIFDAILRDKHIPDELKTLLAVLELPVLKLALSDKSFFFLAHHPVRRTIELLARLAIGWDRSKGQTDPLYSLIERSVRQIRQESERRPTVFADVVAELDAFMRRDEAAATQALSAPITNALKLEKMQEATKAARNEVALRVGTGEVVAFVETFLEDKWVSVLTLAYSVQDEKPQAVDSAIRTMDDLCWSVKPKITMPERKELLAKLPGMIAMLNKWLDAVKWHDGEREKFFADLATCHASIVRAPLELSPERQMQIALAVAKKAAERRKQRLERQQPEPEPDQFTRMINDFECGTWVEFAQLDGRTMKVKLAWISPMRNLFIFATRDRKEAMSVSAEVLAQTFRDKRARVVSLPGLVGRVLASALGIESANSASMAAKSVA